MNNPDQSVKSAVFISHPSLQVKSQTLQVEANMDDCSLQMISLIELGITFTKPSEPIQIQRDMSSSLEFIMFGKQFEILEIKDVNPVNMHIIDKKFIASEIQANACRYQNSLKIPCAYLSMAQMTREIQEASQQIGIWFKLNESNNYVEEFTHQIQIKYQVKQSITGNGFFLLFQFIKKGLKFLKYKRRYEDQSEEKYLMTEKHMFSSRAWMPVPSFKYSGIEIDIILQGFVSNIKANAFLQENYHHCQ